jgi:hypothetical protein
MPLIARLIILGLYWLIPLSGLAIVLAMNKGFREVD